MKKPRPIRVVIADDHSIVREGLTAVINRESDMEVIAQASNWTEAVETMLRDLPEVAVLDLHMRGMDAATGIAKILEKHPAAKIVIYSAFSTDEEVYQVFSVGARGYVLKGETAREDLLACVRAVSRGETWIHPIAAARLTERMTTPNLTSREIEVLRLMVVGKSNKEIGSSLNVTEGTVKVHVNHILSKLGAAGRVEAIVVAVQRGFVNLVGNLLDSGQRPGVADELPSGPNPSRVSISKVIGLGRSKR
jgi:two-component system NarL family response regulator